MRLKILVSAILFVVSYPSFAKGVEWKDLQEICRQQFAALPDLAWNGGAYFPTKNVVATQPRFAFQKFKNSLAGHIDKHEAEWDPVQRKYLFQHDGGQSLYPQESKIKGVVYRGKFYIVDGHHRALESVYTGSTTIPVEVLETIDSHVPWEKFLAYMEDEKLVYSHTPEGEPKFYDLCDMKDDPNLFLARLITLRATIDPETGKVTHIDGQAKRPLIIKINRGRTRQEYDIARIAAKLEIEYHESWGNTVPRLVLEKLAKAFKDEGWGKDGRVILLDGSQTRAELDINQIVKKHFKKYDCEEVLGQVN